MRARERVSEQSTDDDVGRIVILITYLFVAIMCVCVCAGTQMSELSDRLNYDREVIRVWFCNKRQALKNTIKKLRTQE